MLTTTPSPSALQSASVQQAANESFVSERRFYDDKNFPKGFRRSGDFTYNEAELLEKHGVAMQALAEGRQAPRNPEESHFVEVVRGNSAPGSLLEKIWVKYVKLASGKPFYAVVGTTLVKKADAEYIDDMIDDDVQDEPELGDDQ
ncbi:DUF413 domain-containing protein [Shewanella algae]|uniref:DUF413 domain-containing protein n=1 Tax=Shewanella algae TaxID=38313 RepID=UPI00313E1A3B